MIRWNNKGRWRDFPLCTWARVHFLICAKESFLQSGIYCSPLIVEGKMFCWFDLHCNCEENSRCLVSQSSGRMSVPCHLDGKGDSYWLVTVFCFIMFTLSKLVIQISLSFLHWVHRSNLTALHSKISWYSAAQWLLSKADFKRALEHLEKRTDN